jgi:hypothetical protein
MAIRKGAFFGGRLRIKQPVIEAALALLLRCLPGNVAIPR